MNTLAWTKHNPMKAIALYPLLALLLMAGCKKETTYVYGLEDVPVNKPAAAKDRVKSQTEFIAIAYSDLTGNNVSVNTLESFLAPYLAFGDQKLIEQMIIKSFLNNTNVTIPSNTSMRADIEAFVTDCYTRFYNREPDEFELWYLKDLIEKDANITPTEVYFALMTSDEYRYY